MEDIWDAIGFVISSRYRVMVLHSLSVGPATPTQIADEFGEPITPISRALGELRERSLVDLLVPEDRKKGRVYGITGEGRDVWQRIRQENMVNFD